MERSPIIVALDGMELDHALDLAKKVSGKVWGFKMHVLIDKYGPEIINLFKPHGNVFVDMKLHDIPNTVKERAEALVNNGADLITVHASGGENMMRAASESVGGEKVAAVTVLTSLSERDSLDMYGGLPKEIVGRFASAVSKAGIENLVCSPKEVAFVKRVLPSLRIITPSVRLPGGDKHDQKRVSAPGEAMRDGASLLVVGREITQANNPLEAIAEIEANIKSTK